jgi:hypothetical protein
MGLDPFFSFALAAVALVGAAGCAQALSVLTLRRERIAAAALAPRVARHGLWIGVWLVGIPGRKRAEVTRAARRVAENGESPEQIAAIWRAAGARVIEHLPGPEAASAEEACAWLRRTAEDLSERPTADGWLHDDEAPFALLYASASPPITGWRRFDDVARAVLGNKCLAAAFIVCATTSRAKSLDSSVLSGMRIAAWALLTASIALVVLTFVGAPPAPAARPPEPGAHRQSEIAPTALPRVARSSEIPPTALPTAASSAMAAASAALAAPADPTASATAPVPAKSNAGAPVRH